MSSEGSSEDALEREHFIRILNAFRFYRSFSRQRVLKTRSYFESLPARQRALLPEFDGHLEAVLQRIDENQRVVDLLIGEADQVFENVSHHLEPEENDLPPGRLPKFVQPMDMDKVQTTLKQIVRDWTSEGAEERKACYQPIINELLAQFPPHEMNVSQVRVLVPGSGLGRLAYDIARQGFCCQGNEWSLFMLFASNFILNRCRQLNAHTLYPWLHHSCNNLHNDDQLRSVAFPDVNPGTLAPGAQFSMAAGDFLEVYSEPESWDCVATCFFIDTAHNVLDYVDSIWTILRPGGVWINLGPLLYHFADTPKEDSLELSYQDLRRAIVQRGFVVLKEQTRLPSGYIHNQTSMLHYEYHNVFFVSRKPSTPATS